MQAEQIHNDITEDIKHVLDQKNIAIFMQIDKRGEFLMKPINLGKMRLGPTN